MFALALLSPSLSGNLPVQTERGALCTISRIFNMTHAPYATVKNLRLGKLIKKNNNPAHNSRVNSFSLNKSCLHFIKSSALPAACQKRAKRAAVTTPAHNPLRRLQDLALKRPTDPAKLGKAFLKCPAQLNPILWGTSKSFSTPAQPAASVSAWIWHCLALLPKSQPPAPFTKRDSLLAGFPAFNWEASNFHPSRAKLSKGNA